MSFAIARSDRAGWQIVWPWLAALSTYGVVTAIEFRRLIGSAGAAVSAPADDPFLVTWIL